MNVSVTVASIIQVIIFVCFFIGISSIRYLGNTLISREMKRLIWIGILGITLGIIKNSLGQAPPYMFTDLLTLTNLVIAPAVSIGFQKLMLMRQVRTTFLNILVLICIFLAIVHITGMQTALLGSFVRYNSTAVRYSSIYLGFYGGALMLYRTSRFKEVCLVLSAIVVSLAALGKWSIPASVILVAILVNQYNLKFRKRFLFVVIPMVVFIVIQIGIADYFATRQGFYNFADFITKRVVVDGAVRQVGSTEIYVNVRDGSRFAMWEDIIVRVARSPWIGIGIGRRALDDLGPNTHNVFVFYLGCFGVPVFLLFLIQTFRFYRCVFQQLCGSSKERFVFICWSGYLLFSFSVGASFDQGFNIFFAFLPVGVFIINRCLNTKPWVTSGIVRS